MKNTEFVKKLNDLLKESGDFGDIQLDYGYIKNEGKFIPVTDRDLKNPADPREMVRIKNTNDEFDISATFISVEMDNNVGALYDIVEGLKQFIY